MHYNGKGNDKALWDLEMEILWGVFEKGAVHPFKTSINQNDEWVKFDQIMYDKDHTSKTSEEWKTAILNCGVENIFLIDEESNKQTYGISNEKGEFIVDFKFSVQPQNGDKNGRRHLSTINAEYYNNKNNFDMAKKYTKSEIEGMIKNLKEKEKKARSKWGKAVLQDAQWLLENVLENMKDGEEVEINETLLLNGAKSWKDFSYGGCAYVANIDIARHYATPSQFKQLEKKDWEISENETLCDVQARALRQAWWAIRDEMNGTTEFSMSLCEFEEKKGESNFDMDKDEYWGLLIEYGIATEDELQLITDINGYSEETLDDVLYARTGYRSWEQYKSEFSIIDDTKDVLRATGKLAGNIVKNTTDKGGLLMF